MQRVSENVEEISVRYAIRRVDARLKRFGLAAKNLTALTNNYSKEIAMVDPSTSYNEMKERLEKNILTRDLAELLKIYDNKGLFAHAASVLGLSHRNELQSLVSRLLSGPSGEALRLSLAEVMPVINGPEV